jgi:aspartyl protease family protein
VTFDESAHILWYVLAMVLVGSALIARRVALRSAIGMVLAWIAIFAVVLVIVSYRREVSGVAGRVQSEVLGKPVQRAEGQALHVAPGPDGHYWVDGTINGTPARFLIDSGATITALSEQTARAAGLNIDPGGMPVVMQTANGAVDARRSSIGTLAVGPVRVSDLPVVVSPAFGEINVIGMNMLSRLRRWGVENGEMVLVP